MKSIYKLSIALLLLPLMAIQGQNIDKQVVGDSLTLSNIINSVINNYPSLKKAEKDIQSENAKIDLTKTAYLPDVNFATSYTRLGPTTSITMPIGGVNRILQLYPEDVYSAAISV